MGVAGAVLALLVLVVGTTVAIMRVKSGRASPIPGVPALSFLAIPLFDMVVFAILVSTALYFRRRLEAHKRLMTLAMISLLAAPIARIHFPLLPPGPPTFFGLADLFIVALLIYDLVTRRKVHPATIWAGSWSSCCSRSVWLLRERRRGWRLPDGLRGRRSQVVRRSVSQLLFPIAFRAGSDTGDPLTGRLTVLPPYRLIYSPMPSPEKIAYITGATQGIGRATALALGRAGYAVGLVARTRVGCG